MAWGLCFGSDPAEVASWAALVPLVVVLAEPGGRKRFGLGLAHGLGTWLTAIPWIAYTLEVFGRLPGFLSILLLVVLAAYLALYHAAFTALGGLLWRAGAVPALAGLPALWVVLEGLRGQLLTGFPWNLAAYAWADVPGALPLTAWVGSAGLSFLVVFASTGLALGIARRRWEPAAVGVLVPLVLLAAGGRWGAGDEGPIRAPSPVRIVQPDVPIPRDFDWAVVRANAERVFRLSEEACAAGALVVWPESAGWPYSFGGPSAGDAALRRRLEALAAQGCPVLFNSAHPVGPGEWTNSAFLLTAAGVAGRYDKRHLVPFGEYVPLGELLPFIKTLARQAGNFSSGSGTALLPWGEERLGVAVCYEAIFPGEVAAKVRAGATVLVTISNDAWYGDSKALDQHFRAARFRAAENRRPLVRAAITGVSGLIAADGRVVGRLAQGQQGVLAGRVDGREQLSAYTRRPWLVPAACLLLTVALLAFAIVRRS